MHGWGSGVFDAGQIRQRNVQYPASFNTRKIKQLEIVSLPIAPNLPAKELSAEGTSLRGLLQVPGCAWPSVCLLFFFFIFPCLFLLLFALTDSIFLHSDSPAPPSTPCKILKGLGHIFSLETNVIP